MRQRLWETPAHAAVVPGPIRVARSPLHGRGVFAARDLRKGERIGRFEGVPTRRDGAHVLWCEAAAGRWVARRGTNALRFVNHGTSPNAEFVGWDLVARRRIRAGDEILVDYGAGDA